MSRTLHFLYWHTRAQVLWDLRGLSEKESVNAGQNSCVLTPLTFILVEIQSGQYSQNLSLLVTFLGDLV